MDASILLVGDPSFRASLLDLVRDLATFTVEVVNDPFEAMPIIQAQQPDLLIVQASQPDSLELFQQVKNRVGWLGFTVSS